MYWLAARAPRVLWKIGRHSVRVLIACEESGVVRDAFLARGHDAVSNDLQPARRGGPHLQMDCREAIRGRGPWDIIIFHPDCTKMAVCGNRTYGRGKPRHNERWDSVGWTILTWEIIKRHARVGACMENPQSVLWSHIDERPQWVHPFMFGHPEQKKTGLALDRLPRLKATNDVSLEMQLLPRNQRERIHFMAPGPNRKRDRSETFLGIAEAKADQWGSLPVVAFDWLKAPAVRPEGTIE